MDYGSLYGMGSYFGQDYTAFGLMRLATLTEDSLAQTRFGKAFDALPPDQQAAVRDDDARSSCSASTSRSEKSSSPTPWPAPSPRCGPRWRAVFARSTSSPAGPRPTASIETEALHTADFLIYSALTTVARRPDTTWSWTENWPYEPEVGNTPTTNTFMWTWVSFCFTFFASAWSCSSTSSG